jgi:hypothetical protein
LTDILVKKLHHHIYLYHLKEPVVAEHSINWGHPSDTATEHHYSGKEGETGELDLMVSDKDWASSQQHEQGIGHGSLSFMTCKNGDSLIPKN